jgi:predicted RNA-binding protein
MNNSDTLGISKTLRRWVKGVKEVVLESISQSKYISVERKSRERNGTHQSLYNSDVVKSVVTEIDSFADMIFKKNSARKKTKIKSKTRLDYKTN